MIARTLFTALQYATFISLLCISFTVSAQTEEIKETYWQYGFETSFGCRLFKLQSNIPVINDLKMVEEGGTVGFTAGNGKFRVRANAAGFYYSAASVPYTIDMFESAMMMNVYPINLLAQNERAIQPFISVGANYSNIKFHGNYIENEATRNAKKSNVNPPYLGSLKTTSAVIGAGFEFRFPEYDFFHLFTEVQYSVPVNFAADHDFTQTTFSQTTSFNIGVAFGSRR